VVYPVEIFPGTSKPSTDEGGLQVEKAAGCGKPGGGLESRKNGPKTGRFDRGAARPGGGRREAERLARSRSSPRRAARARAVPEEMKHGCARAGIAERAAADGRPVQW